MKKLTTIFALILAGAALFAQEAVKSIEEEYYDFLSLTGIVERPALSYRTLSDSEWRFSVDEEGNSLEFSKDNVWNGTNIGLKRTLWQAESNAGNRFSEGIDRSLKVKIYGPEWYNSYNTSSPYGQNDGALWQGKGYNTSLTAGARLESYGFELTFKPQLSFSQNREFEIMDNRAYYTNKYAYIWSYGIDIGADAPQRFGDSSFFTYDWGDTEARWSWHTFTLGFGTQAIWLGPAWLNPLLHSNNAPTYPKFDIGLRKTQICMPYFGWNLGEIEARLWIGRLTESGYFDNDSSNNHNQITGMSFSYAPSFLPGLTLGVNKICLSKWNDDEYYKYLNPMYGSKGSYYENEAEDQKISLIADWLVPKGGIDVFAEFGIDDHINADEESSSYITHYWHTFTYTFGLKKEIAVSKNNDIRGEVIFEWNNTEMSQDMQMHWPYNFGFHHVITQGYTNKGQWLGSGIGYGGQSQYLGFKVYYPKGVTFLYIHRFNPDNNFLFKEAINSTSTGETGELHEKTWNFYKGILAVGIQSEYFILESLKIGGGLSYVRIVNPLYNQTNSKYEIWHNIKLDFSAKYYL